jgi:hypothetical protein
MKTEYYFHTKSTPRTTICGILNTASMTFDVAIAQCGKKDQFERKIGRQISKGRVQAGKIACTLKVNADEVNTPGRSFVRGCLNILGLDKPVVELI